MTEARQRELSMQCLRPGDVSFWLQPSSIVGIIGHSTASHTGACSMIATGLRKTIDRIPVLRAMVKSRLGQHLIQTVRGAGSVREPLRFAALQLGPQRAAGYRLRDSDLKIFIRHQTHDIHIFLEIFGGSRGSKGYEPPANVASALDANPSPTVLDLGGNIGLFGAYVLGRWPRATIRSYEPDPTNLPMLTRVIADNELEGRWSLDDVAVANHDSEMTFVAGLSALSHLAVTGGPVAAQADSARPDQAQTVKVRTVDIFEENHGVDLLKMDIEGGEWSILTDNRLSSLRADVLVLEWHASGCPDPDPHATAVRLLRAAGYDQMEEVEVFEHRGVLWAWRESGPLDQDRQHPRK
jgi:FkbM family methyltransferase